MIIWLKVQNEAVTYKKKNRSEHGGRRGNKDEDQETDTASTARDRQPEGGSGKTGRTENSKRDPAFLTWGAGKEEERQKGEQRHREGGIGGREERGG